MKIRRLLLTIFPLFTFISISSASTPPFYGDNPCGSTLSNTGCAIVVSNANLDNIAHSIVTGGANPGNRVDFRDKATPGTYYWFSSGADSMIAKSILAVLLTAKSQGSDVKVWIAWSSANGDSRNFNSATLVNP